MNATPPASLHINSQIIIAETSVGSYTTRFNEAVVRYSIIESLADMNQVVPTRSPGTSSLHILSISRRVTATFVSVEPNRSRSSEEPSRSLRTCHWPFVIVCLFIVLLIALLIALMAAFSQQRTLHDETEEYLNEMHDKVHQLEDDYTKTRQDNEWLKQENQEQSETIEATRKEVCDLKEKLQNECDLAKEKENEKCRKTINVQGQTIQELRVKLQAAERQSQKGESRLPVSVYLWMSLGVITAVGIVILDNHRCWTRDKHKV